MLFSKLRNIIIEDFGIVKIPLLYDLFHFQNNVKNIEYNGGLQYFYRVSEELCQSVKDRSASDLVNLSKFYQDTMPDATLEKKTIFTDPESPIVNRLIAGWEILGASKLPNKLVFNQNDNINNFILLNKSIIKNEKILSILKAGYNTQTEPHFIALGLLSHLFQTELTKIKTIGKYQIGDFFTHPIEEKPNLIENQWLLEAIDWDTKEGKRAITHFLQKDSNIKKFLIEKSVSHDILGESIGALLFRVRGHNVNKRLIYPSAIAILRMSEHLTFKKITNLNNQDYAEAVRLFKLDLPLLDSIIMDTMSVPDKDSFPF